jgi:hypothetical protein
MDDGQDETSGSTAGDVQDECDPGYVKDELGLLISAWLFDPEISALFQQQQHGEALERAGLVSRNELIEQLRAIDPEQIRQLVELFRRPLDRPMS